jgi:chromosome segregation ATPase
MNRLTTSALSYLCVASIAGCCSTASPDPREGGYIGGACGISQGTYEARLNERRETLAGYQDTRRSLEDRLRDADQSTAKLDVEVKNLEAQLHRLQNSVTELDTDIAELLEALPKKRAKLVELMDRNDALAQRLDALFAKNYGANQSKQDEADPRLEELNELEETFDSLIEELDNLTQGSPKG